MMDKEQIRIEGLTEWIFLALMGRQEIGIQNVAAIKARARKLALAYLAAEAQPQTVTEAPPLLSGCGCCSTRLVLIRGEYPGADKRLVCPCCQADRLSQINEISHRDYGKTATAR